MYDFIDRPVSALDPGGALFLFSMRQWVGALATQQCPPHAIGPAFAGANVLPALPHFHMAMMLLTKEPIDKLRFPAVNHAHIAEDEAVLLQALVAVRRLSSEQMRATLGMIVLDDAVVPLLAALAGVADSFAEVGLEPGIAAPPKPVQGRGVSKDDRINE